MARRMLWSCSLLLGLCALCGCWAAPAGEDVDKYGELERTLKELTSSILAMTVAAEANSIDMPHSNINANNWSPHRSEPQF